jgi:hypothetical protein
VSKVAQRIFIPSELLQGGDVAESSVICVAKSERCLAVYDYPLDRPEGPEEERLQW